MNYNEKYPIINCNSLKIPYQLYINYYQCQETIFVDNYQINFIFLWISFRFFVEYCPKVW